MGVNSPFLEKDLLLTENFVVIVVTATLLDTLRWNRGCFVLATSKQAHACNFTIIISLGPEFYSAHSHTPTQLIDLALCPSHRVSHPKTSYCSSAASLSRSPLQLDPAPHLGQLGGKSPAGSSPYHFSLFIFLLIACVNATPWYSVTVHVDAPCLVMRSASGNQGQATPSPFR